MVKSAIESQSSVRVIFPADAQPGNALYRLRKALKKEKEYAVEIHKQSDGALIVCAHEVLSDVCLTVSGLDGYKVPQADD
jgi:hypothetical protein